MKGYYDRPEATEAAIRDGWFRTGDVARRDEDGYYYIIDRSKDMIIRGGYNVPAGAGRGADDAPGRVAGRGRGRRAPARRGDQGVRDPEAGAAATEDELVAWGKEQFANYKYPRIVEFRDELPMTATGKILKRELR